jgi:hypothetical protein
MAYRLMTGKLAAATAWPTRWLFASGSSGAGMRGFTFIVFNEHPSCETASWN